MKTDDKLWLLIYKYKLLQIQARVYLANNDIDKYTDCLDKIIKIEAEIQKCQFDNDRDKFLNKN